MAAPSRILGIGAPLVDNVVLVPEDFLSKISGRKGGMELIAYEKFKEIMDKIPERPVTTPAGCTVNIIKGLAHLGHQCTLVGKFGRDDAAAALTQYLEAIGIRAALIPSKTPTAQALCLVTPDGERTIRTCIGAAGKIKGKHISDEVFEGICHVHIEGYSIYYGTLMDRIIDLAHKHNVTVSMDLGSFETVETFSDHFRALIAKGIDVLFANDKEAFALTGKTPREACLDLSTSCPFVAVTEGPYGCWVTGKDLKEPFHCDAEPVGSVVDTTGAGDSFACGFLHGFLLKQSTIECAHKGGLAASMVIQIKGTDLPKSDWLRIK
jgi:sugar/nucleoside kinase (ribokinase family)